MKVPILSKSLFPMLLLVVVAVGLNQGCVRPFNQDVTDSGSTDPGDGATPTPTPNPTPTPTPTPLMTPSQAYTFQWSDEFDLGMTNWLDHEAWDSAPGYSANDGWIPIPATDLVEVVSGVINLKKRACANPDNKPMCGAELLTRGKFESFVHGHLEAKVKVPAGADSWVSLWLMGNGTGASGWPMTGEIDIFEFVNNGSADGISYFTAHWGGAGCTDNHCAHVYDYPPRLADFADDYHIYSFTRTADLLELYIDQVLAARVTRAEVEAKGGNPDVLFNSPMHLRLTHYNGGGWADDPAKASEEADFLVDYIRIWSF